MPTHSGFDVLSRIAIGIVLILAQPIAKAGPFPGDTEKLDESGWFYHHLGDDKHCLLDNPDGLPDTVAPGTAAVLYKEAPATSGQSDQLFIYVEGGGSCNDVQSCTSTPKYPKNKQGYPVSAFQEEDKLSKYLYLRTTPLVGDSALTSPFKNMNMAMIPYCTGDSHTGRVLRKQKVKDEDSQKTSYHFYGHFNFIAAIDFLLTQQFQNSNLKTIWLMGASAGAGGVAAQYAKLRDKFMANHPERQIHLIEDSAPSVSIEPDHWDNMATWQTKIQGSPCTPPPNQRPTADSEFASLSSLTGYGATTRKTKAPAAKANRSSATTESNGLDPDDYPTGLPYPFPPEESTTSTLGRRSVDSSSFETTDAALAKPRADTCYFLNETRIYNREMDPGFRYSMLSFVWDNVLPPKKTAAGFGLYFSRMSANDAAVTNVRPSKTKHLYFDNTLLSQVAVPGDAQGTLCGRHVPTNFNTERVGGDIFSDLQSAYYAFISAMLLGTSAWTNNDGFQLIQCPGEVIDGFSSSF